MSSFLYERRYLAKQSASLSNFWSNSSFFSRQIALVLPWRTACANSWAQTFLISLIFRVFFIKISFMFSFVLTKRPLVLSGNSMNIIFICNFLHNSNGELVPYRFTSCSINLLILFTIFFSHLIKTL